MQAIILAGGFGKRLHPLVSDRPKPMALIAGRPHLAWLLDYMEGQGVSDVLISLHYMHGAIRDYFGGRYGRIRLEYVIEDRPLGTGGAIAKALAQMKPTQPLFVLNGDSLVELGYRRMLALHHWAARPITLATLSVADGRRYGALTLGENHVERFASEGVIGPADISAGFYVLSPEVFDGYAMPEAFSFERDFLMPHTPRLQPAYYNRVNYFIDIGVPADYQRAQREIPARFGVAKAA